MLSLYTVNILFSDALSFSKGSYEYWITISSDAVGSFPVLGSAKDPIYYYSSGDGPSPSVQRITYVSSFDEAQLVQKIDVFLSKHGFEKKNGFFIKENDEIYVAFTRKSENLVEVSALLSQQ